MLALSLWLSLSLAATPLVPAPLPSGFKLDGSLEEWKGPPTWVLDPKDQPVGRKTGPLNRLRVVRSADDLSARVWLAVGLEGLILAGEVNDDHYVPRVDQVQVWLALPRARLPRIAFANALGENEIPDSASCETSDLKDPAACKQWLQKQVARRKRLDDLFLRHYEVGDAVHETWEHGNAPPVEPALTSACCAASEVKRVATPTGWRFELRIAPEDFPLTHDAPLASLKLAVGIWDGDQEDGKRPDAVETNVPEVTWHLPGTYQNVSLTPPVAFDSEPPLLVALRKEQADRFYRPGRPVQKAFAYQNAVVGSQAEPTEPSPSVMRFALGKLPLITTEGDARLFRVQSDDGDWLWSFRGSEAVAHLPGTGDLSGPVTRKGGQDVALLLQGTKSPYGSGECGACPNVEIRVVRIKGDGRLQQLFRERVQEGEMKESAGKRFRLEGIKGSVKPDLSEIAFRGTQIIMDDEHETTAPFQAIWRYDEEEGRYVSPQSDGGLPAPTPRRKKKR